MRFEVSRATIARLATPALTSIRQPCAEIAETAFRRLVSRIFRPDMPAICISLPSPLAVRDSTKRISRQGKKGGQA